MCPKPEEISKALLKKIEASFPAGMSEFKKSFTTASLSLFGSGYVWLVTDDEGSISIISTKNQVMHICTVLPRIYFNYVPQWICTLGTCILSVAYVSMQTSLIEYKNITYRLKFWR